MPKMNGLLHTRRAANSFYPSLTVSVVSVFPHNGYVNRIMLAIPQPPYDHSDHILQNGVSARNDGDALGNIETDCFHV